MTVVCRHVRTRDCNSECLDGPHVHVRCETCSLPGFWASIHFEASGEDDPAPSGDGVSKAEIN